VRIIPALAIALISATFVCRASVAPDLKALESRVEDNPDSVFCILGDIDRNALKSRKERSEYALLLSEASYLNYIDIASDSLIGPAADYFMKRGSGNKKLKACFYRAIAASNAGDSDLAMEWLKKGEKYSESDFVTASRLYRQKSVLYYNMFDFRHALVNTELSGEYSLKAGDELKYVYRKLDYANILLNLGEIKEAKTAIGSIVDYWDITDEFCRSEYYTVKLAVEKSLMEWDSLFRTMEDCRNTFDNMEAYPHLRLKMAEAYLKFGYLNEAFNILESFSCEGLTESERCSYLLALSDYHHAVGDDRKALELFKEYNMAESGRTTKALSSDIKFVEERYEKQINEIKSRNRESMLGLTALLFIGVGVLIIRYISIALRTVKVKLSETENHFKKVEAERNALIHIQENSTILDRESLAVINQRLVLLDKILLGHLSQDPSVSKDANKRIEEIIDNKDDFTLDTSKVFCASRKKFAGYLKSCELTDWEIGYCCLFLMGMYGKDMEPYISKRSSNTINATIRGKLEIPSNGQKLKSFLLEKFNEIEGN